MIKKTSMTTPTSAQIIDGYGTSTTDGYSQRYINDINSYDTTEIKTNKTWIDGKPIYRKCYNGNTGYNNISIDSGITNLNQIISLDGIVTDSSNNISMKVGGYMDDTNNYSMLYYVKNTNKINCTMPSAWYSGTYTLIIEYTKTTD